MSIFDSTACLFSPIQICALELGNRIVMAPMTRGFSPNGVPTQAVSDYYQRRAEQSVGLITTEGVGIAHSGALGGSGVDGDNAPHIYGDKAIEGWRNVVDNVHRAGAKIIPQLWHQGPMRETGTGPYPDAVTVGPTAFWGPLDRRYTVSSDYLDRARQKAIKHMTDADIADVIKAYGDGAANAVKIGFDGIAIHGAHGYLIDSFLWAGTNSRTDGWSGDIRGRTRFACEILREIRTRIPTNYPIFFRFSQWKQQDLDGKLAYNPNELEQLLGPLADAGVDVFDASQRDFDTPEFEGSSLNLAGWAKKLTGKFSQTVGGIGSANRLYDPHTMSSEHDLSSTLHRLTERMEAGEFDLVAIGRALMHDPAWAHRVYAGEAALPFDPQSRFVLT